MLIVITGGAASGKSAQAERILCKRAAHGGSRLYLATMQPFGQAARARMLRHHKLRAGKGFDTVERYTGLEHLKLERQYDGILLECMSNLLANEQFSPDGVGQAYAVTGILRGIDALRAQCGLVVVTNEIFSDGKRYPEEPCSICVCWDKSTVHLLNGQMSCSIPCAAFWLRRKGRFCDEKFMEWTVHHLFDVLDCAHAACAVETGKYAVCAVLPAARRGTHWAV